MKVLIKSAKIFNSESAFHLKIKDILITDGIISKIEDSIIADDATVIEGEGLLASAGWFDLYSVLREPGVENKDNLETLLKSALTGGFTDILGISGSDPSIYNKAQIQYLKNNTAGNLVTIHPAGTITEKKKGKNITELYDMHRAGAVAFSDGKKHIEDPEILKRALLYVKPFGGKVMVYSEDCSLSNGGMVNEGEVGVSLGMKVRPAIAEEVAVHRNIEVARYVDAAIHLQAISSKRSLEIIKKAKEEGVKVTCDVNVANLLFTDAVIENFDTAFKVLPVLRAEEDRQALLEGLKSGVIDGVTSGHTPQDIESKACEFDHAEFGMMTLECLASALLDVPNLDTELVMELLAERSRKTLEIAIPEIKVGEKASLSLCSKKQWTLEKKDIKSISKNNPFIGTTFSHKVIAVINNGKIHVV